LCGKLSAGFAKFKQRARRAMTSDSRVFFVAFASGRSWIGKAVGAFYVFGTFQRRSVLWQMDFPFVLTQRHPRSIALDSD